MEINLENIEHNVKKIITTYSDYQYYFGVLKADCYGHDNIQTVKSIIKGGCNYLCVATLDEALEIRKELKEIPILCLGVIDKQYIDLCIEKNIVITIPSLNYIEELDDIDTANLKVHLKINTGMNRLGIKDEKDLKKVYKIAKSKKINIEGIYTHIYEASEAMSNYRKPKDVNGCRLGIIMYGFSNKKELKFYVLLEKEYQEFINNSRKY